MCSPGRGRSRGRSCLDRSPRRGRTRGASGVWVDRPCYTPPTAASRRWIAAVAADRDQAEELHPARRGWPRDGCLELVLVVGRDVDDIAGLDGLLLAVKQDGAGALDDENLVLVVVAVAGGGAAGRDEEVGEGGVGGGALAAHDGGPGDVPEP